MFRISKSQVKKWLIFIAFVAVGAVLNVAGNYLSVTCFDNLFYLDTVGTMVVAIIGGYFPGVLTALISSLLSFSFNPIAFYYLSLNVIVALVTSFYLKKYSVRERNFIKIFLSYIVLISLCFSFFATILTYGQGQEVIAEARAQIVQSLTNSLGVNIYYSFFFSNFIINLIDKSICALFAYLIIRIIPDKLKSSIVNVGWLQKPLTYEQKRFIEKRPARKMSIKIKIIIALITACLVISFVIASMSRMLFISYMENRYLDEASGVSSLAAGVIEPDMVDEYIEKGYDATGYKKVQDLLYKVGNTTSNVEDVFVYKVAEDGYTVVFDVDREKQYEVSPGTHLDFDVSVLPYVDMMLRGESFDPYITDDEEIGYYLTSFSPVYDNSGSCVCYAGVDISKRDLDSYKEQFMTRLISLCLGFMIMIIVAGLWFSKYHIIYPVNALVKTVEGFGYLDEDSRKKNVEDVRDLGIHTGDEIENLYFAFLQAVEENMINYSYMLQNARNFDEAQSGLIIVLAELVENRDASTGNHIRKTATYTGIVMNKMRELGYYKDQLTDDFITNVIKSAPLHDVGKIRIPDAILNKPGRLTDEEFEIMKMHAPYGGEVVEQCIFMLPKAHYLSEAKKIAESHHEKWNGKGYPQGLSGEDIPLSARIMAVADVFDALVSKRIYKPAFAFDEAMDIIKKDSGTHFDPKVAEAFLAAREEIREAELRFRDREEEEKEKG
ncbi:MAG: HD domain-containing protein [Lachnospiraceae bacterium]|nr:HD domain-containing protein [Lachnospiraceae bacterium]